ncbi:MAG: hypothetical protein ACYTFT_18230 [Planctomycetota bacterium]|jgi:hypothetical protein
MTIGKPLRSFASVALLAATFGLAGCSEVPLRPAFRLESSSFVFHGYSLGSQQDFEVIIEKIRFNQKMNGSLIVQLAFINRRPSHATVDLNKVMASVGGEQYSPHATRTLLVRSGGNAIERATLSFQTQTALGRIRRGSIKIDGVPSLTGTPISFGAAFFRVSDAELESEIYVYDEE